MPAKPDPVAPPCYKDEHTSCPHWAGMYGQTLRQLEVVLCSCACHQSCPMFGVQPLKLEELDARCTCPGAASDRARRASRRAERDDRRRRTNEALEEVRGRIGSGRSTAELKAEIEEAFARHDVDAPPGLVNAAAQAFSAGTGPRVLVAPRLGLLGARLAARGLRHMPAAVRWLRDNVEVSKEDPHDEASTPGQQAAPRRRSPGWSAADGGLSDSTDE